MAIELGAWAGRWALANPEEAIEVAHAARLTRLDIICNDHAGTKWWRPRVFDTYDLDLIRELTIRAQGEGLDVHYMSWITPWMAYQEALCATLGPLMADLKVSSLVLDAEEPWTKAKGREFDYDDAADYFFDCWAPYGIDTGITGIGSASKSKLGRLMHHADYGVPQCYSTATSKQDPEIVVERWCDGWRRRFGEDIELAVGLAAYRQSKIPGYTLTQAVMTALDGLNDYFDGDVEAIYWQLKSLRSSRNGSVAFAINRWMNEHQPDAVA